MVDIPRILHNYRRVLQGVICFNKTFIAILFLPHSVCVKLQMLYFASDHCAIKQHVRVRHWTIAWGCHPFHV